MIEYHAITIIILLSMIVMMAVSYLDKMLPAESRKGFILLFGTVFMLACIEWLGFYMERNNIEMRTLSLLRVIVMFSIIPIAPMVIINSIGVIKFDRIYKVAFSVNLFLQVLSAKFGFIYYVDEHGVYHRGDFYFIYLISIVVSMVLLFISFYQLTRKFQHKGDLVLVLIGLTVVIGITIQMMIPAVHSIWLSVSFSSVILYVFYYVLLSETDQLTLLLNRKCFDNQLQGLNKDAIIIYFDVNDFKHANDNFGHTYGDHCLELVSSKIRKVYRFYGSSYRIGGDEFAVIMTRNLEAIVHLNNQFTKKISLEQKEDNNFPSVSVGYGHYFKNDKNITNAIEKADEMMYDNKRRNKLNRNQMRMKA